MNGFETELKIIDDLLSVKKEAGELEPAAEQKLLAALDYIRIANFGTVTHEATGPGGPVAGKEKPDESVAVARRLNYLVEMMENVSLGQADIAEAQRSLQREQRRVCRTVDLRIPRVDSESFIKGFGLGIAAAPVAFGTVLGVILLVMNVAMKIHVSGALIGGLIGCSVMGVAVFLYGACKNQKSLLSFGILDDDDEWEGELKW